MKTNKYRMILYPHIDTALKRGESKEKIREILIQKKWPANLIDPVLKEFK